MTHGISFSRPTAPLTHPEAMTVLQRDEYGLSSYAAAMLLDHADRSVTGMATAWNEDDRPIWATSLVTMPGRYIIEFG